MLHGMTRQIVLAFARLPPKPSRGLHPQRTCQDADTAWRNGEQKLPPQEFFNHLLATAAPIVV
jgi:hypothetical protein